MASPTPKVPDTTDFAERELALTQRERDLAKREISTNIDGLIKDGKVLAAAKTGLIEFMAGLEEGTATVEFGEGTGAVKQSPRQFMQSFLDGLPQIVDFGEHSKRDGSQTPTDLTAEQLAEKAGAYHSKKAAAGQHISFTEAMTAVTSGKDKE